MAARGSNKARSVEHEEFIAHVYGGVVSPSSGASVTDKSDVRTVNELYECKLAGRPEKPSRSTVVKQMEKVADEAWAEGRDPVLALRFFKPDSILANSHGYVDLIIRLVSNDAMRLD